MALNVHEKIIGEFGQLPVHLLLGSKLGEFSCTGTSTSFVIYMY